MQELFMRNCLLLVWLFALPLITWAGPKEFVREYTHAAGDADSKITSRQIAKQEIKRELLNEVGTNIFSQIVIIEDESGVVASKQEVRSLTAGLVKMEVIEEKWNGLEFYIKAKMIVDPDEVHKQINELISNDAEQALLRKQLSQQAQIVEDLRNELTVISETLMKSQSEQERMNLSKAYVEKSKEITANDLYERGLAFTWGIRGESINYAEAVKWYVKASELGHKRALYELSLCYYEGKGVPINYESAATGMQKLARMGFANAQYHLSSMFRYGHGVDKDYEREMYWLEMAAEQDLYIAQISLDERYSEGGGVPTSTTDPIFWLEKSAERGDVGAQYKLAIRYRDGLGVEKSKVLFFFWLRRAGDKGYKEAISLLKELKIHPYNKG